MSLPRIPYRTGLSGTEIVALLADAFEGLDGMRRHIGAHASRVRARSSGTWSASPHTRAYTRASLTTGT